MRQSCRMLGAISLVCVLTVTPTDAAFYSVPRALKGQFDRIGFGEPALQPMAHTLFCLRHPEECRPARRRSQPRAVTLTEDRWRQLVEVNREVNRAIAPKAYPVAVLRDTWTLNPASGDCNDYAITKRHRLIAQGWPSHALLLAVVQTISGAGHLVLVARTRTGDFVLDNLRHDLKPWTETRYAWVQIQSPRNPNFWANVETGPISGLRMLAQATSPGDPRSGLAPDRATLQ